MTCNEVFYAGIGYITDAYKRVCIYNEELHEDLEKAREENSRLRKLVRDMMRYYFMPSAIDSKQREAELLERAHELGVEDDSSELWVEVDE